MAGPRPTAIHFTLVFCVLLTLGLGAATWTLAVEYSQLDAALTQANELRSRADARTVEYDSEIQEMKTRLGYLQDDVGVTADGIPPQNSVLYNFYSDLQNIEGILVGQNAADALRALHAEITRLEQINSTYTAEISRVRNITTSVQTGFGNRESVISMSQQESAARLQTLIAEHDRLVTRKQSMITQLRSETQREQNEKEALRDELNRVQMEIDSKVAELEQRIENLNLDLERVRQVSFERADGLIIDVDNTRQEVYINLGSADLLTEQVTFSVYIQNHNGIGRGVQDIKGAIEVTRILGPHQALARITYDDITRPIAPGDPIFSPIWQSGISEQFAFVGIVDLDGDKVSDWEILTATIEHAGSQIQFYVDDQGNFQPPGADLNVQTKYLVVGRILDQSDFPGMIEMQEVASRIQKAHFDLTSETLRYGVRIVTMNEFLTYIGYQPQEYHWVPGQQRRFNFQGATPAPTSRDLFGQDAIRNEFEGLTNEGGYYAP